MNDTPKIDYDLEMKVEGTIFYYYPLHCPNCGKKGIWVRTQDYSAVPSNRCICTECKAFFELSIQSCAQRILLGIHASDTIIFNKLREAEKYFENKLCDSISQLEP